MLDIGDREGSAAEVKTAKEIGTFGECSSVN